MARGAALITQDLDICAPLTFPNLSKIVGSLKDVHPVYRFHVKPITPPISKAFCKTLKNLSLRTDIGDLDILGEIPHFGDYRRAERESDLVHLEGVGKCRVLNLDALIDIKSAVGRPRDKEAVILLKAIREGKPAKK